MRAYGPQVLSERINKGRRDCGSHEWYRSKGETWLCYHCDVGKLIIETPNDSDRYGHMPGSVFK